MNHVKNFEDFIFEGAYGPSDFKSMISRLRKHKGIDAWYDEEEKCLCISAKDAKSSEEVQKKIEKLVPGFHPDVIKDFDYREENGEAGWVICVS
jgi:hypothetical protein